MPFNSQGWNNLKGFASKQLLRFESVAIAMSRQPCAQLRACRLRCICWKSLLNTVEDKYAVCGHTVMM